MSIFATKSIEDLQASLVDGDQPHLKRVLGAGSLVLLGIGAVIGAGIFVLTGQAAAANAGPAVVLSMALAGLACALAALCYSEFASSVPVSGSAYTYAYATLGEFIAWIIGWDLILEYALGAATVAVGWSGHFVGFLADFGWHIPAAVSAAPGTVVTTPSGEVVTAVVNLPAIVIAFLVTCLLIRGIRESATFNSFIVMVKVSVVFIVIVGGAMFVQPSNWHPFIPPNTGTFGEYGWSGIVRGAAVIFFSFIGFDAVSTAAQEAKNPQRDMPIGILGSLAVCTVLYVLVSGVMVGLVPYAEMKGSPAPMVVAIEAASGRASGGGLAMLRVIKVLVEVGALAGLTSVMTVMMMAQPRIFLSMANDGLFPAWARIIHPRFRTPHYTTILTGVVVALASGFTGIATLSTLVNIGTLFAFVIVSLAILFLRYQRPDLPRPFRTPFVPFTPILSALVSIGLMASLPWPTWERLIIWMAIGVVLYFCYGYRHSVVRNALKERVSTGV